MGYHQLPDSIPLGRTTEGKTMSHTIRSQKSEGGNKRGHSQMNHMFPTAEVKDRASRARRRNKEAQVRRARIYWGD